jgi:Immunoglobulin-like domain of bacterial spore germination
VHPCIEEVTCSAVSPSPRSLPSFSSQRAACRPPVPARQLRGRSRLGSHRRRHRPPRRRPSSEKIALDKPVTRATYRERFLPLIFVDRPAWGAALPNQGRVTGLANVFEARFRMALFDHNGKVLVAVPARASCGTGCWGTFAVTLSYDVARAQWGTLRVWVISEFSGRPAAVREYPVYLRPAP